MSKFLIRRLLLGIFIIIMGSLVFYSIIRCLPASYVEKMARQFAASTNGRKTYQEWLAELNHVYGMDSSILNGFLKWGSNAIRGNFGDSWKYMRPVTEIYSESIWWSVLMNIITFILEIVVCIPLGILAARKQYSKTDYAITLFALAFEIFSLCQTWVVSALRFDRPYVQQYDNDSENGGCGLPSCPPGADTCHALGRRPDALYENQYAGGS